jgi:hypothetical protein
MSGEIRQQQEGNNAINQAETAIKTNNEQGGHANNRRTML